MFRFAAILGIITAPVILTLAGCDNEPETASDCPDGTVLIETITGCVAGNGVGIPIDGKACLTPIPTTEIWGDNE